MAVPLIGATGTAGVATAISVLCQLSVPSASKLGAMCSVVSIGRLM
jgi:hypothetical protein